MRHRDQPACIIGLQASEQDWSLSRCLSRTQALFRLRALDHYFNHCAVATISTPEPLSISAEPDPARARRHAIIAVIAGELCFAVMGGIIKHLSTDLDNATIVFFRNALAICLLAPMIALNLGRAGFVTREWHFHLLRGVIGVSAMSCFFYVLGHMHFTEAILLKLTTPFFIPLVALFWLRETSSKVTWLAIALGFVGVVFIADPQHKGWSEIDLILIGLLGAVLAAVAKVTIRRMRSTEPSLRIVFYFSVIASLCSLPFALQHWQTPSLTQWIWLASLATVATIGQLLITAAYRRAKAGQIGQFTYTSLVFSSAMGWWLWGEALTLSIILGCVFIVSAGLINLKST